MKKISNIEFILRSNRVHEYFYDYSKTNYINARTKVEIYCPNHGSFFQRPFDHLNGSGCKICVNLDKKTNDSFIEQSKKIHGQKYGYEFCNYTNNYTKIILICKKHGEFKITPNNHLSKKQGCSSCKESKGEAIVSKLLTEKGIEFQRQKTFKNCKGKKRLLPFDFYLPKFDLLIEFDGQQHFQNSKGLRFDFDRIKETDFVKNDFAKKINVKLLRIPYTEINNIENILASNGIN